MTDSWPAGSELSPLRLSVRLDSSAFDSQADQLDCPGQPSALRERRKFVETIAQFQRWLAWAIIL